MLDDWTHQFQGPPLRQIHRKDPKALKSKSFGLLGKSLLTKSRFARKLKKQADPPQGKHRQQQTTAMQSALEDRQTNARMLQSGPHMPHNAHGSLYHHNTQPPHGIVSHTSSVNSTDQTENPSENSEARKHYRSESLHVNWTEDDVRRMAGEVYGETIADVHLSLLAYCTSTCPLPLADTDARANRDT